MLLSRVERSGTAGSAEKAVTGPRPIEGRFTYSGEPLSFCHNE